MSLYLEGGLFYTPTGPSHITCSWQNHCCAHWFFLRVLRWGLFHLFFCLRCVCTTPEKISVLPSANPFFQAGMEDTTFPKMFEHSPFPPPPPPFPPGTMLWLGTKTCCSISHNIVLRGGGEGGGVQTNIGKRCILWLCSKKGFLPGKRSKKNVCVGKRYITCLE
jgi:hypothetical protein